MPEVKAPVVLIFFRRRCVLEVLRRLRDYAPERLFLIADGGRTSQEHEQCQEVRQLVEAAIDWPCRVERLYSDRNLGCRGNIPRGITWAFAQVDRAVILEDDTVPTSDFFTFCAEMLERYADDTRVMTVSGTNYFPSCACFGAYSYLFSGYAETCGYATWARAWKLYDADLRAWPAARDAGLLKTGFLGKREQEYWFSALESVWSKTCECDPYDFQWLFASFLHGGLSIVPRANLVTNIGSGPEATHTKQGCQRLLGRPAQVLPMPLNHPPTVVRSDVFDQQYGRFIFYGEPPTAWQQFLSRVVASLPEPVRAVLRSLKR